MSAHTLSEPDTQVLLSLDEIRKIFEQLDRANSNSPPLFSKLNVVLAYEPMIHPHIADIFQLIASFPYTSNFHETIATNGSRIARAENHRVLLEKMKDAGLRTIQLSPYGLESIHDWFACRKGAFQDLMSAARRGIEVGLMINWQYFFHKKNVDELGELVNYGRKITKGGESKESISIVAPAGRGREIEHLRPDSDDLQKLPEEIREIKFLPDLRSEAEWIEEAVSGRMEDWLREYYRKIRERGYPELFLRFDRQNINSVSEVIDESRHRNPPRKLGEDLSEPDLRWLAREYGDKENKALYKASMMRNKWLRIHRSQL
jgi:MoaA/NifB/PqqE/SkfB family radical SAM enzyme